MPRPDQPLTSLGFLTIGLFDPADPRGGHESTLRIIELGEQLGLDSAWLRNRHLQHGISSPLTMLAAASQRTTRIELGTAVIPLGWENPLRLAEDLATVDLLSGGRLNPGVSVGTPMQWEHVKGSLYPDTSEVEDFTYRRVERLIEHLRGDAASTFSGRQGIEEFSDHVQPHATGLLDRLWYGAGSTASAAWTGAHGLNLLTSSVVKVADGDPIDFATIQTAQIHAYREALAPSRAGRVSQGLVVIPTDTATPEQVARYTAYVEGRTARTLEPQGPARLLFARDLVGPSEQIAEQLYADSAFREVGHVVFPLPFSFEHADYVQILTDVATRLGPALGWTPAAA